MLNGVRKKQSAIRWVHHSITVVPQLTQLNLLPTPRSLQESCKHFLQVPSGNWH